MNSRKRYMYIGKLKLVINAVNLLAGFDSNCLNNYFCITSLHNS
jgi:hypothetical protein